MLTFEEWRHTYADVFETDDAARAAWTAASNKGYSAGVQDTRELLAAHSAEPKQAPFGNCQFRICDLPGQCRAEGKCHHPAARAAEPKLSVLTEPQIEAINDAIATLDRRGWPIDEYFAKVFREMLAAHSAGAQEDALNEAKAEIAGLKTALNRAQAEVVELSQPMTDGTGSLAFDYGNALVDRKLDPSYSAGTQEPVAYTSADRLKRIAERNQHVDTMWPASMRDEGDVPLYAQPQPMPQTDAAREALAKHLEANFHDELKVFLSKRDQGKVMGIFRRAMEETAEIERLDRAKGE